jgi:8-oxo-dGTP pyrophosphatase MutT (NUDIX family)
MDNRFPSTRLFSLSTLALAVSNDHPDLGHYILTNTSNELLLNPDLHVKLSPELTMILILHAAAANGFMDIIKLMLEKGLVTISSKIPSGHVIKPYGEEKKSHVTYFHGGNTCLHAYLNAHQELDDIKFFIESGVDPNAENEAGETGSSIIRGRIKLLQSDRDYREALDLISDFDAKIKEFASKKNSTMKEMKETGEYDRIKNATKSVIINIEKKVQTLNRCLEYLASKNANSTFQPALEVQPENNQSTVAAIIVGLTPKGEKIVVLGEKGKKAALYSEQQLVKHNETELLFPGGLKETNCIDHREAMIKEVKEETGIDLNSPHWKHAKISLHHLYKKRGAGSHGEYHHEVFVIDLGEQLYHAKLYARDDLWKIYKVPVSNMIYDATAVPQKRYRVTLRDQSFFVRHSNAKSIEIVCSLPAADDYGLEAVLDLEFDGYYKSCDAAARGDIAELERLKAYGVLLEPKDFDHVCKVKTIPIREAIIHGHFEAFKWFLSNNLKTNYINNDNLFSAAVKNNRSEILQYLCQNNVSLGQMWTALYDADEENKEEYLLVMLNCLIQNTDTNPYTKDDNSLTSLEDCFNTAVPIAIKRGYKEVASQLLKDRRIQPSKLTSSDDDNCYVNCLKQGWFDLIFSIAKLEIQKKVLSLPGYKIFLIRIQKTEQGYSIQTDHEGPFYLVKDFNKAHRFSDETKAQRIFNLLIVDYLCSLIQKPESQTSQLTHFKPNPDKDLIEFISMLKETQSPGHEIATALLSSRNRETIPTRQSEQSSMCILN